MIFKFQAGGGIPPLVSYTPVMYSGTPASGAAASTKASSSSSGDKGLKDKDLLTMLEKLDGLPNDMAYLNQLILNFYNDLRYALTPLDTNQIAANYMLFLFNVKNATFNKKEYDNAFDQIKANGGLNEIAVDSRGQIVCRKKNPQGTPDDYLLLTLDELSKNKEYAAITNSELLLLRANSPELINNNSVLSVVQQGIGMKGILELINSAVSNLGSDELSTQGYSSVEQSEIRSGLKLLKEAAKNGAFDPDQQSINGLYKNTITTSSGKAQIDSLLGYLLQTLPENAKTILQIKGLLVGGILNLLLSLLMSKNSNKFKFETDYESDLNPDGTKKASKTEQDNQEDLTGPLLFLALKGASIQLPIQAGTADTLKIDATVMPAQSGEGKNLGITTLAEVAKGNMGGIFNFNQVTVGNQQVDMSSIGNVVVNANLLYRAYLPLDLEKLAQGIIAPNLTQLGLLEKVRNEIKHQGLDPNTDGDKINAIYLKYGLPKFVDENGNVDLSMFGCFGVMNATTLSDAFGEDSDFDNMNFTEVKDDTTILNTWDIIKGKNSKEKFSSGFFGGIFGGGLKMLQSLVYLPLISMNPILGAYSGGKQMTPTQANQLEGLYQEDLRRRLLNFKPAGNLQL